MDPGVAVGGTLALPGLFIWVILLLLPWQPWRTRESLDAEIQDIHADLSRVTVLIPARNEQDVITKTLDALAVQDKNLKIILIDDQSEDQTAALALQSQLPGLKIISGQPLPEGWSGKLWALEQGRMQVKSELVLLLDADIEVKPGTLNTLVNKLDQEHLDLLSLMAHLRMQTGWEKLLMPAFIFFFKLLYPFRLSNSASPYVAAAAGGCMLVKTSSLNAVGAFASLSDNLIDDCALARKIKDNNGKIWIGQTHSAISIRAYNNLEAIREMVARCAFAQLRYSWILLFVCTLIMVMAFVFPVIAVLTANFWGITWGFLTILIMYISYYPTLLYYNINPLWGWCLPVIGTLYMLMTWSSALRHLFMRGALWKNRSYPKAAQK